MEAVISSFGFPAVADRLPRDGRQMSPLFVD